MKRKIIYQVPNLRKISDQLSNSLCRTGSGPQTDKSLALACSGGGSAINITTAKSCLGGMGAVYSDLCCYGYQNDLNLDRACQGGQTPVTIAYGGDYCYSRNVAVYGGA